MNRHRIVATVAVALLVVTGCGGDTALLENLRDDPMAGVVPRGAREIATSTEAGGSGLLGKDSPTKILRTLQAQDGGGEELFDALRHEADEGGWAPQGPVDEQTRHVVALFDRDPGSADYVHLGLTWDRGNTVLVALTGG